MTNTKTLERAGLVLLGLALLGLLAYWTSSVFNTYGSAPSGLPTQVSTTSTVQVGLEEEVILFPGQAAGIQYTCNSRIVTTRAQAILINFAGTSSTTATTTVLGSTEGNIQAASTTVVYDAGLYGCGYWGAKSVTASSTGVAATTTVTVTETR